ncbi:thiamine pyrophosphate-dependent dehydrogenase E1 component subunit alpha [Magnetococcales bacterium HHB-1]
MQDINWELYQKLYLIRRVEDLITEHYMDDEMKTPMHMSAGGEAISTGVCQALDEKDQVVGTYRSHALYLAKTGESDLFMAEMYGKESGVVQGKGGSMHLIHPESGLICTSAIVASNIPVAIGAAFANKQKKNNKLVAVFFGDGAIDEGAFWESLNIACLMKLPILFICEDNGLAVHIPAKKRHGYDKITDIVKQFHCDVWQEETTDAEKIWQCTKEAAKKVRTTMRPAFMHFKYYRYLEHVGVFDDHKAEYRDIKALEQWKKIDPINLQRNKLLKKYPEAEIIALEKKIDQQAEISLQKAKSAPFPPPESLYKDLWA